MAGRPSEFRPIDYLEWARLHMGRVRYDLARSDMTAVSPAELGIKLSDVEFSSGPDGIHPELRALLAERYGVAPERILVTAGATMGLYACLAALVPPGGEVILETPHYEPLRRLAEARGASVKLLERPPDRGFEIDLESLERMISRNTDAVLLTNLHNPSGQAVIPERLMTIGQIARDHGVRVIVDEVYLDAVLNLGHKPACATGPNMISVNSLTKVCGLGGLRLGWVVAPEGDLPPMRTLLDYVSGPVSAPSQRLGMIALRKIDVLIDRCVRITGENRAQSRSWAAARGDVSWLEPAGGTLSLLKLPQNMDAQALSRLLREKYGTLVVPGDFFSLKGVLRISLGSDPDTFREGIANVGQAIDELKRSWR